MKATETKFEFYVVTDEMTGECLVQYDPNDPEEWHWDDWNYEGTDLTEFHRTARFATPEEAVAVRDRVLQEFRKWHEEDELLFKVNKIETRQALEVTAWQVDA